MKNVIPRNFTKIVAEMLIDTSCDKKGDIVHVFKDEYGYIELNICTGSCARPFVSMLRNSDCVKIIEIV